MSFELSPDDRRKLLVALQRYAEAELDIELGELKGGQLLDWLLTRVGGAAYFQGVSDAQAYLQTKLIDMEIELLPAAVSAVRDGPYKRGRASEQGRAGTLDGEGQA